MASGRGVTAANSTPATWCAHSGGDYDEVDELGEGNASAQEAAAFADFAGKPSAVLTASTGGDRADAASHVRLASMSTNSAHRVIDGATPHSLIADEDDSAATRGGILDVVSSARSGARLSE